MPRLRPNRRRTPNPRKTRARQSGSRVLTFLASCVCVSHPLRAILHLSCVFDSERWRKAVLRKNKLVTLVALLGIAQLGFADQITLRNGDHLSGKVVKSDGKTLVLHTEFAGDVTVKFDAITQITTDEELHITISDKKTYVGPVTTSDGKIEV